MSAHITILSRLIYLQKAIAEENFKGGKPREPSVGRKGEKVRVKANARMRKAATKATFHVHCFISPRDVLSGKNACLCTNEKLGGPAGLARLSEPSPLLTLAQ